jgi:hypothetical protein
MMSRYLDVYERRTIVFDLQPLIMRKYSPAALQLDAEKILAVMEHRRQYSTSELATASKIGPSRLQPALATLVDSRRIVASTNRKRNGYSLPPIDNP